MRFRWAVIIFAIAFFLQTAVLGVFPIFGVSANLILCLAVMTSFVFEDDRAGLVMGAAAALLHGICFEHYMGTTALPLVAVVLITMLVKEFFFNNENFLSALIVSFAAPFLYYNFYWLTVRIAGFGTHYLYMLQKMPVYILLNGLIMLIMYFIMTAVTDKHRSDRYTKWAR